MIGTKDITNLKYYTFYILISHWQHHMWLFINLRFLSKLLKMGLLRSRIHSNFNSKGCDISRIQLNMDPSSQNGLPCIISLGSPWLLTQTCHHPWLASSQTTVLMDCSFLGSFTGDWSAAAHTWGETRISSFLLHMTCNGWWASSDGEQVRTAGRQRAWITISKLDGLSTQDSSYLSQNVHIPNVTGLHFRSPQWGKVYVSLYTRNLGQRVTNRVTNAGQRTNLEDSLKRRCELVFDGYLVGW